MDVTYGSQTAILSNDFPALSPAEQKEGVLLLRQLGMTKRQILQQTRLFSTEYDQLFDKAFCLHKLKDSRE